MSRVVYLPFVYKFELKNNIKQRFHNISFSIRTDFSIKLAAE